MGSLELFEKLLPFLDLAYIKKLAEAHLLTREILGKTYVWGKLVEKIFPMNPQIQFLFNNDNSVGLKYGFDSRNRPRASFCKYWLLPFSGN